MPEDLAPASEAVVICTRNRPDALRETLQSVASQSAAARRLVIVVDGSDCGDAERTTEIVQNWRGEGLPVRYHRYSGTPAGTRQRNAGVDQLPDSVEVIHFLDDDVMLRSRYFAALRGALQRIPRLLGAGGIILKSDPASPRPRVHWGHRLFLLRVDQPSRVLPSGQTTPAWAIGTEDLQPAEWLSTCASSYRASVFDTHRFDPAVEGPSPRLEDLDFSARVAEDGPLAVVPDAQCVHRVSPHNRRGTAATTRERLVRRYWFVRKNMDRLENRLAFWWSVVGQLVALVASSHPDRSAALRGHLQGLRQVWTRAHPLLHEEPTEA
ncbi:glycosyltransferase family 2 protein [Salinibacter altiplanensis]|uniref:glycosyltransferase family 2 protein n=1 Tax=Salinibacter altiplanensis TaxID=1803181 RepID=UPI0013000B41|nr:glycosyltransferase family 2 protein [Salinibacter altiplanensis]